MKTPEPNPYRSLTQQAQDIADKTNLYDSNVKVLVDLDKVPAADRAGFMNAVQSAGGDMTKIVTVPR